MSDNCGCTTPDTPMMKEALDRLGHYQSHHAPNTVSVFKTVIHGKDVLIVLVADAPTVRELMDKFT